MDIDSWLKKYPGIRIAKPSDNEKLLEFYSHHPMKASTLGLQFQRAPDYYAMLRARADENLVFLYENPEGQVRGIAVISFREGFINGVPKLVGYLGDLRVGMDRTLVRTWKKAYAEFVTTSHLFTDRPYPTDYLTAIVDDNAAAQSALTKDKRGLISYKRVAGYKMVNVFRRYALASQKRNPKFEVSRLNERDFTELSTFFERENQNFDFGFVGRELRRRMKSWPRLTLENGIVVRNQRGKICGFTWLWNTRDVKSVLLSTSSIVLRTAAALVPGLPRSGTEIQFLYMTSLTVSQQEIDRELIKTLLVDEAYRVFRQTDCHFLALCEFESDPFLLALRPYICFRTPMALYSVSAHQKEMPLYSPRIGFEMAVV